MENEIIKQIVGSFPEGEEYITSVKIFRTDVQCHSFLILSNKRLFIFDNKVGNDDVEFFALDNITEIKKTGDEIVIKGSNWSLPTSFFDYENVRPFFEKMAFLTNPILEEKRQIEITAKKEKKSHKIRNFLKAFFILVIISGISVGGTLAYRAYTLNKEKETKQQQLAEKQKFNQKLDEQIYQINNQMQFGDNYQERLDTYLTFIEELQKEINSFDASDKTSNIDSFKTNINTLAIKFKDIQISDEDMSDYNVVVSQEPGYISKDTKVINQNIDMILSNVKNNIDNRFSDDPSLLINIKQMVEDTITMGLDLKTKIDSEKELLYQKSVELESQRK